MSEIPVSGSSTLAAIDSSSATAALQLGIFTAANLLRFRGYKLHKAIYGLTLTSAALASGFLRILGNLATVEAFYEMLAKMLVCVVLEGILCSLLSCYIVKKMMQ